MSGKWDYEVKLQVYTDEQLRAEYARLRNNIAKQNPYNRRSRRKDGGKTRPTAPLYGDNKRHCICNKPNDGTEYVQCDDCNEWFHPKCVGLTPGELSKPYICEKCKKKESLDAYTPSEDFIPSGGYVNNSRRKRKTKPDVKSKRIRTDNYEFQDRRSKKRKRDPEEDRPRKVRSRAPSHTSGRYRKSADDDVSSDDGSKVRRKEKRLRIHSSDDESGSEFTTRSRMDSDVSQGEYGGLHMEELLEKIVLHERKLEKLRQENRYKTEMEKLRDQVARLRQERDDMEDEKDDISQKFASSEGELRVKERELEHEKQRTQKLKQEKQQMNEDYNRRLQKYSQGSGAANDPDMYQAVRQVEADRNRLANENEQIVNALEKRKEKINSLQRQIRDIESKWTAANSENIQLNQQLKKRQSTALEKKVAELSDELIATKEKLWAERKFNEAFQKQYLELRSVVAKEKSLEEKNARLTQKNREQYSKIQKLEQEQKRFQSDTKENNSIRKAKKEAKKAKPGQKKRKITKDKYEPPSIPNTFTDPEAVHSPQLNPRPKNHSPPAYSLGDKDDLLKKTSTHCWQCSQDESVGKFVRVRNPYYDDTKPTSGWDTNVPEAVYHERCARARTLETATWLWNKDTKK